MDFFDFKEKISKFILTSVGSYDKIEIKISLYSNKDVERERGQVKMPTIYVADFLIDKYSSAKIEGKQLLCTRTKLGKLMTIVQILFIKVFDKVAFSNKIFVDTCGTSIPDLSSFGYPYCITESSGIRSNDDSCNRTPFENGLPANCISDVAGEVNVNTHFNGMEQKVITDVFLRFGGCESIILGQHVDTFKDSICENGVLDVNKTKEWLNQLSNNKSGRNPVVEFIKAYKVN